MLTLVLRSVGKPFYRNRQILTSFRSCSSSSTLQGYDLTISECNVPPKVVDLVGRNLHLHQNHPLNIIKSIIEDYWRDREADFGAVDNLSPVVSTHDNFDSLLIPEDHVSRSKSDTYYLNDETLLRCHTSAHQSNLLKQDMRKFLVTGDVYRKDEIDATHYPVFHQMEGVKVFDAGEDLRTVQNDLKEGLEGMVRTLFGDVEMKWSDDYFPFTDPSFELEINYQDKWLEVLGCGVMQPQILQDADITPGSRAWAFGLGLERLAMVLFEIPDIRLFWSRDRRFLEQFESGRIVKFQPFSKYPPVYKDIAFWLSDNFHPNELAEVVREVAGDLVEKVELIDSFTHPKTERQSNCFRITYRSMDRNLTDEEINALQDGVREQTATKLGVELR